MPLVNTNTNTIPSWRKAGTYEPSPELQLILNRAEIEGWTQPNQRIQRWADWFISGMIMENIWQVQDSLLNFRYGDLSLLNFSRINWVNPMSATNLVLWSTDFSNAIWSYSGGNLKAPNTLETPAPDGTFTACKFENLGTPGVTRQLGIISNSTTLTYSIYTKAGTTTSAVFRLRDDTTATGVATGTINYTLGTISSGTIEDVGNGWFKISLTATNCVIGNSYSIYVGDTGSQTNGESWYIWHPMVSDLNFATNVFVETEGTPVYGNGVCTPYGGIIYTIDGFEGNEVNGYINSQYNPSQTGVNYLLDNASMSSILYKSTGGVIFSGNFGAIGGNLMFNLSTLTQRINQSNNNYSPTMSLEGIGFLSLNRNSSTDIYGINKSDQYDRSVSSTTLQDNYIVMLERNGSYSGTGISFTCFGAALTYNQTQALRTIYNQFQQNIGQSPIA